MSVLGLDVGTSTCKGIVLADDGRILAQEQRSYAEAVRIDGAAAELSPRCFENGVKAVISSAAERCGADPIRAIAVSSHGETLIPVGADGAPLADAMLSMDRRSQHDSDLLIERLGRQRLYQITGSMMHPQFPVPKVMYLRREKPEIAQAAVHYDTANDYIYRILGCPGVVDFSIASRFGGLDVHKRAWSDDIMDAAELPCGLFSVPVNAAACIGYMPEALASSLGLKERVALVSGGHDQPCAALSIGGAENALPVSAGSYECAILSTDTPMNGSDGFRYGLNSYCHVLPGKYATLAFFVSGMMVRWYLDTFYAEESHRLGADIYSYLERQFRDGPTGICFTPHIFGAMNPEWSEHAAARISGLTAGASKTDLYKAVLEGTCCELDLNIRVLEKLAGPIRRLVMSGGGSRSDIWMQLRADITGKEIDVTDSGAEASCLGAAILAGIGIGVFSGPEDALNRIQRSVRRFLPRNGSRYETQKANYLLLHRPGLLD